MSPDMHDKNVLPLQDQPPIQGARCRCRARLVIDVTIFTGAGTAIVVNTRGVRWVATSQLKEFSYAIKALAG